MLRCCARRRGGALERLRGDVIDLPYKPPQHNKTINNSSAKGLRMYALELQLTDVVQI